MGPLTIVGLLLLGGLLFIAGHRKWIRNETLELLSKVAGVIAAAAALLVFVVPAAIPGHTGTDQPTLVSLATTATAPQEDTYETDAIGTPSPSGAPLATQTPLVTGNATTSPTETSAVVHEPQARSATSTSSNPQSGRATLAPSQLQRLPIFKAEASSEYYGRPARLVFDTNTVNGTGWLSTADDVKGAWIKVYMPSPNEVSQLRIYLVVPARPGAQLRDVTISFDDGSTYNAQLDFVDGWQSVSFPTVTTESISISVNDVFPSAEGFNQVEIRELDLYGAVIPLTPVGSEATPAPSQLQRLPIFKAEASSEYYGRPARLVFDTNTVNGTGWLSTADDVKGAWIKVYMPSPNEVSQLRIYLVVPARPGAQLRDVTISFDDGSTHNARLNFVDGWQSVSFLSVTTESISISVNDVFPSAEGFNQVEIRELELLGQR